MRSEKEQAAIRHLVEHPAYRRHLDLEAFGQSLGAVFRSNFNELLALLEEASTNYVLAGELVQNVHDDAVRRTFTGAVTQRLHNYLASTFSLVDHSRRLMRNYSGPCAPEYERRKAILRTHDEVAVVIDLRTFVQHRLLPELGHHMAIGFVNTPQQTLVSEVELDVGSLLAWKRWSPTSRRFLRAQEATLQLRPLVRRHGELVYEFNHWLYEALADDNAEGLREVNRLVVEANATRFRGTFEEAEGATARWTAQRHRPGPTKGPTSRE